MIIRTNTTTERLEGFARARGLNVNIARVDNNRDGRFFVVGEDARPLYRWWTLGWTADEARATLEAIAEKNAARSRA